MSQACRTDSLASAPRFLSRGEFDRVVCHPPSAGSRAVGLLKHAIAATGNSAGTIVMGPSASCTSTSGILLRDSDSEADSCQLRAVSCGTKRASTQWMSGLSAEPAYLRCIQRRDGDVYSVITPVHAVDSAFRAFRHLQRPLLPNAGRASSGFSERCGPTSLQSSAKRFAEEHRS